MLKNFLYLNESNLEAYLSSLEGGIRGRTEQRTAGGSQLGGGINTPVVSGSADRSRQFATSYSLDDSPHARFERLEQLATADVERSGWITVVSPDNDLEGVGIGALVDVECEVYVPQAIKALSAKGGLTEALDALDALAPSASALGLDTSGMPDPGQVSAMRAFASSLGGSQVVVGECTDSDWRLAGKLLSEHLRDEVDGVARVVGKVSAVWTRGQWKPLMSLPGMNLIPREQRRKMEREGPTDDDRENWLEGPAVMLDVLAVYR